MRSGNIRSLLLRGLFVVGSLLLKETHSMLIGDEVQKPVS